MLMQVQTLRRLEMLVIRAKQHRLNMRLWLHLHLLYPCQHSHLNSSSNSSMQCPYPELPPIQHRKISNHFHRLQRLVRFHCRKFHQIIKFMLDMFRRPLYAPLKVHISNNISTFNKWHVHWPKFWALEISFSCKIQNWILQKFQTIMWPIKMPKDRQFIQL